VEVLPPQRCGRGVYLLGRDKGHDGEEAGRRERMERKRYIEAELAGPSMLDDDDPQWEDLILATELWHGDLSSSSFFLQTISFKIYESSLIYLV
jgi:hypothetical protein